MSKYAIEVDNVKIRFNLASENVDNLKEYAINSRFTSLIA